MTLTVEERGARTPLEPVRIVLVHGAATTASVWRPLAAALSNVGEVVTPQRNYSGDWETELGDLAETVRDAFVVGVSGGATLGLELATRGTPMLGAVLHEPAAGSLAPHLLDHVIRALNENGVEGFGRALYGEGWEPSLLPADSDAVKRDLGMFRAFEPTAPTSPLANVTLTVGEHSPRIRHESVEAIAKLTGAKVLVVPGAGHGVQLTAVQTFAKVIAAQLGTSIALPRTVGSWQMNTKKGN
jgi:pimeloyl-ACP methyl ester carboxylesterase